MCGKEHDTGNIPRRFVIFKVCFLLIGSVGNDHNDIFNMIGIASFNTNHAKTSVRTVSHTSKTGVVQASIAIGKGGDFVLGRDKESCCVRRAHGSNRSILIVYYDTIHIWKGGADINSISIRPVTFELSIDK